MTLVSTPQPTEQGSEHKTLETTAGAGPGAEDRAAKPAYHPLAALLACVLLGAVVDRVYSPPWPCELILGAVVAIVWVSLSWSSGADATPRMPRNGHLRFICLLMLGALTAALAHHLAWRIGDDDAFHSHLRETSAAVVVEAVVTARLDESVAGRRSPQDVAGGVKTPARKHSLRKRRASMQVKLRRIRDGQKWQPTSGIAVVHLTLEDTDALPTLRPGDAVRIYGEARRHSAPMNPGDWDPRLSTRTRRQALVQVRSCAAIQRLSDARWWSLRRRLDQVRTAIERSLRSHVRTKADLAIAMLLGRRDLLTFHQNARFVESGTSHLLALSGLHVGLVVSVAWLIGRMGWLSRKSTCVAASAMALTYLVIAGPRASLIRATVLVVALAWSRWLARPRAIWNALAAAALILAALDPSQLFDTGAQLSFLAVAALCRWGTREKRTPDPLARLIRESRPWLRRWAAGAGGIALRCIYVSAMVWLITAPIAAWRFGRLAPIGILLNPIAGPLVAAALYACIAVVCLAWVPPAASAAGWIADAALTRVEWLASWGASIPGGHWAVVPPSASWAACGCGLWLGWAAITATSPRRHRVWLLLVTSCWCLWGLSSQQPHEPKGTTITVLSVGHGTCVVLRTPDGHVWVYDAGRLGGGSLVHRSLTRCLAAHHDTRIDRLIISHEDVDHYNAVERILATTPVREIMVGPRMLLDADSETDRQSVANSHRERTDGQSSVRQLAAAIKGADASLRRIAAGDHWERHGVTVRVLHPPRLWEHGSADNADSVVLRISYRGYSVLLTGDVEGMGLLRLRGEPLRADVILAPHHGSPHSFPAEFARHCAARWVLVSSGYARKELNEALRGSNIQVLQTAIDGAAQVRIDEAGLTVRRWRQGRW